MYHTQRQGGLGAQNIRDNLPKLSYVHSKEIFILHTKKKKKKRKDAPHDLIQLNRCYNLTNKISIKGSGKKNRRRHFITIPSLSVSKML